MPNAAPGRSIYLHAVCHWPVYIFACGMPLARLNICMRYATGRLYICMRYATGRSIYLHAVCHWPVYIFACGMPLAGIYICMRYATGTSIYLHAACHWCFGRGLGKCAKLAFRGDSTYYSDRHLCHFKEKSRILLK
jgi:hypothetical protein